MIISRAEFIFSYQNAKFPTLTNKILFSMPFKYIKIKYIADLPYKKF
jgi:hypothetical protein